MSAEDGSGTHRSARRADDGRPDAALAAAAARGDRVAFEMLYRRHADAAWRVASAVAANRNDAGDAVCDAFGRVLSALDAGTLNDGSRFRPYLVSATRNAAIDLHRRTGRSRGVERPAEAPAPAATPVSGRATTVEVGPGRRSVDEAFRGLPERWRSVLWLTEVEGFSPREVAAVLRLSTNAVTELAVRARAALRERLVQVHLREPLDGACRTCVARLGRHAASALAPREQAEVDQHLTACAPCRDRAAELDDLRTSLRRIVVPLPALLGAASARWQVLASAGAVVGGAAAANAPMTRSARATKPLLVASTALWALGLISASVVGGPGDIGDRIFDGRRPAATAAAPPAQVVRDRALLAASARAADALSALGSGPLSDDFGPAVAAATRSGAGEPAATPPAPDAPAPTEPAPPGGPGPAPGDAPPPVDEGEPVVNAAASVGVADQPMALSLGAGVASCTGATVGDATVGCAPPPPPPGPAGATVSTDGTLAGGVLDDRSVSVSL